MSIDADYWVPASAGATELPGSAVGVGDLVPLVGRWRYYLAGDPVGVLLTATVDGTARRLPTVSADGLSVMVSVSGAPIRFTVDGTVPTTVVGLRVDSGALLRLTGVPSIQGFQYVAESGAGSLFVQAFS